MEISTVFHLTSSDKKKEQLVFPLFHMMTLSTTAAVAVVAAAIAAITVTAAVTAAAVVASAAAAAAAGAAGAAASSISPSISHSINLVFYWRLREGRWGDLKVNKISDSPLKC
ncbi:hypothetical protein V1477_005959 [Vespula maculifrons]|uniref:Uncharacterized protein n=1 Tax=Vespula maculifrons TaxID=7453 RepID=A0ABD2CL38_VESMC